MLKHVGALPPTFRVWNTIDNWCSLCKEPFGQWNEHRGKRDHICLELFFDAVLDYHRTWSPGTLWGAFERDFKRTTMLKLFGRHDREEKARRQDVFHLISYLNDHGVIAIGPARWRDPGFAKIGSGLQGALVMYKWMHPHILHVFPGADAKQISGFSQMCASMYNLETTFDVCGLKHLIKPGDMPSTPTGEPEPLEYAHKAFIIRNVLGQLRWAMDVDTAIPRYHTIAQHCPPHLAVIAEQAGHALITDMIFCRICEYVSRVEPVWREQAAMLDLKHGSYLRDGCVQKAHVPSFAVPRRLAQTPQTIIGEGLYGRFGAEALTSTK